MARKSRKQNNQEIYHRHTHTVIQTAAYVRLSVDDKVKKGNSIENQQFIISNYIADNPGFELYDTYSDAGISGVTFDRPGFQRMLHDAETGKIRCIIVKDLSRLGRDMISTGYFLEKVFPKLGIRLISIGDDYDSDTFDGGIRLPLTNLMNETFALDISRKTKSQVRQAMKNGIYVGGKPPYGYAKSQDGSQGLVVDDNIAKTVRQIFSWKAAGMSISGITRKLNLFRIPPPGVSNNVNNAIKSGTAKWHISTVGNILHNEIYLGHLTQGRTKTARFVRQSTHPDEWIHVPDTHEAIITTELFLAAQSTEKHLHNNSSKAQSAPYTPNIYAGKIYCAHCGGRMERKRNHNVYIFHCIANRTVSGSCSGNRIHEETTNTAISKQLFSLRDNLLIFQAPPSTGSAELLQELRFIDMEISQESDYYQTLYENLVNGEIDHTKYVQMKEQYAGEINEFKHRVKEIESELDKVDAFVKWQRESLQMLDDFTHSGTVTQDIIERFVDMIEIFRDGRVHINFSKMAATVLASSSAL